MEKSRVAGKPIEYAQLMDINRDALVCAIDAINEIRNGSLVSYSLNQPGQSIPVNQSYDLVICNPPYISRPKENPNNPFEGLFLYQEILRLTPTILKPTSVLLINFSSISKNQILPAFKKVFSLKTLCQMKVPLKIPLITARLSEESKEWMEYLEKNKKLIIDPTEKSG